MKAKVIKTGEIIEVEQLTHATFGNADIGLIFHKDQLDFNISAPEKAVIEGWVARDKDNALHLHYILPDKSFDDDRNVGIWGNSVDFKMFLPTKLFPSIKWESEPRKAKIEITLIDEKKWTE